MARVRFLVFVSLVWELPTLKRYFLLLKLYVCLQSRHDQWPLVWVQWIHFEKRTPATRAAESDCERKPTCGLLEASQLGLIKQHGPIPN